MKQIDRLLQRNAIDVDKSKELPERRTLNSQTFNLGGKRRRVIMMDAPMHYFDKNGEAQELDLDPVDSGDHWFVGAAPFKLKVWKDKIGISYSSDAGGQVDVDLVEVGDAPVSLRNSTVEVGDGFVRWTDVAVDFDIKLEIRSNGIEWFKYLNSANAPTNWKWRVRKDRNSNFNLKDEAVGWDSTKPILPRRFADLTTDTQEVRADAREQVLEVSETYNGRVSYIAKKETRQRAWTTDVVYPIVVDADITENIPSGANDGWSAAPFSSFIGSGNTGYVGAFYEGAQHNGGFRWTTVPIPTGATIDDATLTVYMVSLGGAGPHTVYGQDQDNPSAFSASNLMKNMTKTAASTSFSPSGTGNNNIAVTSIVQEIVDRTGWASNNAMALAIIGGTTSGAFPLDGFAMYGSGNEAVLTINYTAGGGGGGSTQARVIFIGA